jgi:hypothetical protein
VLATSVTYDGDGDLQHQGEVEGHTVRFDLAVA